MNSLFRFFFLLQSTTSCLADSCIQDPGNVYGCQDIGGKCEAKGGMCFQGVDETCCCTEELEQCPSGQPLFGEFIKEDKKTSKTEL